MAEDSGGTSYKALVKSMKEEIGEIDREVAQDFEKYADEVYKFLGKDIAAVGSFGVMGESLLVMGSNPGDGKKLALGIYEAVVKPDVLEAIYSTASGKGVAPYTIFPLIAKLVERALGGVGDYSELDFDEIVSKSVKDFSERSYK
jgi:hypothetical protein